MTIATQLAPFIAWLASREPDAELRRRYREHVRSYLEFVARNDGATEQAWAATLPRQDPLRAERATALARFAEHRQIIERTSVPS